MPLPLAPSLLSFPSCHFPLALSLLSFRIRLQTVRNLLSARARFAPRGGAGHKQIPPCGRNDNPPVGTTSLQSELPASGGNDNLGEKPSPQRPVRSFVLEICRRSRSDPIHSRERRKRKAPGL